MKAPYLEYRQTMPEIFYAETREADMVRDVNDIKDEVLKQQVRELMNRMLTAPKAKGLDDVRVIYVDGEDILRLAAFMKEWGGKNNRQGFIRDSANAEKAAAIVVLGAKKVFMNLDCAMCGAKNCQEAQSKDINCIFPVCDMGIAVGSGVSLAMEMGLDNRVMYSIGLAAVKTGLFNDPAIRVAMGVPFSVASKNIFFDRK